MKARLKKQYKEYYSDADTDNWYDCYFFFLGKTIPMLVQDISKDQACFGVKHHFEIRYNSE